ncbi:hypothetical protein CHS0354_007060 [Potamilus streckersoni]|uniref:Uncharacterized protein n=1 Tax=Potamilus streckersoni TaxID=2493646 RepID=A0AAE0VSE7_9BIVA|nr:hypothetical protein CHS0354_007060 [Potamilus streckersoni]
MLSTLFLSNDYRILDNQFSGRLDFPKTTSPPVFSCFDFNACRTGLEFCSYKRKACEKCEDYRLTCGTNLQHVNCTQYCVMASKQTTTLITTERLSENRGQTYAPDSLNKPGHDIDWKLIMIGILRFTVIILVALNIYLKRQIKKSRSKGLTDEQSALMDVCSSGQPSEDPTFIDVNSSQYFSVPSKCENSDHDPMQTLTFVALPEIRD